MLKVAVLRNRLSLRNLHRPTLERSSQIPVYELQNFDDTPQVLKMLCEQKIDLLAIDGGDGTVCEIVTHLLDIFVDRLPLLAILPHGDSNAIARNIGCVTDFQALEALTVKPLETLRNQSREVPLLHIEFTQDKMHRRGFIVGWGAYCEATKLAMQKTRLYGSLHVLHTVFAVLWQALYTPWGKAMRNGVEMDLALDQHPPVSGRRFMGMATTLKGRLAAGLDPFFGEGYGPLRWLDIDAPARRLWLAAPLLLLRRPAKWMPKAGYRSGRSHQIVLRFEGDIVVDGDLFATRYASPLVLSATERVKFISLP